VDAGGRLAHAAAARIEAGALNDSPLTRLATELQLSTRQLRRVLRRELGVSPIELAQTYRLLLAKRLLTDSRLPIIEVAFASGFASLRRFNALFRARYGMPPRRLRRDSGKGAAQDVLRLTLAYRPPLPWRQLLHFLACRATIGVECIRGDSYYRTVALGKHSGWLRVHPLAERAALAVEITASLTPVLPVLLAKLRDLFDLNVRPDVVSAHLQGDARLRPLVRRMPGLRVPGAFDGFELAVRAIVGQQVSVRAATTLAGRLAAAFGEPADTPIAELGRFSPTPERIAAAKPAELTALGITAARAGSILALARAVNDDELSLHPGANPEATVCRLRELPGIGDWTAQCIALRALRWPDAFPVGDLGLVRAWRARSRRRLRDTAEAWRPWRAYATMYLWQSLASEGEQPCRRPLISAS